MVARVTRSFTGQTGLALLRFSVDRGDRVVGAVSGVLRVLELVDRSVGGELALSCHGQGRGMVVGRAHSFSDLFHCYVGGGVRGAVTSPEMVFD